MLWECITVCSQAPCQFMVRAERAVNLHGMAHLLISNNIIMFPTSLWLGSWVCLSRSPKFMLSQYHVNLQDETNTWKDHQVTTPKCEYSTKELFNKLQNLLAFCVINQIKMVHNIEVKDNDINYLHFLRFCFKSHIICQLNILYKSFAMLMLATLNI